jgi:hypothetical protein
MKTHRAPMFLVAFVFATASPAPLHATSVSADCINCNDTPTAEIMWVVQGSSTDVGWPYVPPTSFNLVEIDTNFAAGLGADRTITAEIFQGIPGQPGAALLGSVSFESSVAHGKLGGVPLPAPVPLTQGQQYFIGFLNVGGLGVNVDADNDFQGSTSDPDEAPDSCDGQIPANPACDPDGAALRLLGSAASGGLHIDYDGSNTFVGVDADLAPVALDAPIIDLRAPVSAPSPTPSESTSPTPSGSICVGDCNSDGQVTVNELITLVNIALGSAQPSSCPNGLPSGVEVNVALVISAVNHALNGCPAGGTPSPAPTATPMPAGGGAAPAAAGRIAIALDTVTLISDVVGAVTNGFLGGSTAADTSAVAATAGSTVQADGSCPLGGTATRSGDPISGETFTLTQCAAATTDGSVTYDGGGEIGLLSGLSISVQMTFKDQMGTVTQTVSADLSGPAPSVTLGGSCYLTGADLTVSGTLSRTMGGQTISVSFANTEVSVDNITFNASCVPTVYDVTLNGNAALLAPSGMPQNVTFNQLVIHVDGGGTPTMITVDGEMNATCFGGTVMLATQSPLSVPSGQNCPTAGVITASTGQGQASIAFQSDGSVMIDAGATGTLTAPNCLDPRLLMCVA